MANQIHHMLDNEVKYSEGEQRDGKAQTWESDLAVSSLSTTYSLHASSSSAVTWGVG